MSIIEVNGLSKAYRLGLKQQRHTLGETLGGWVTAPLERLRRLYGSITDEERLWALRDVSFQVQPGEVVGIIGRNGAGKSTLLKLLSRITEPTTGRAVLRGRVASLLEVGTGFHPELTGRENIFLNGAILGMGRGEIQRKFDQIVDFSEVERFLDTPVKRYSSGMYVRLAFAVAAHLEPEILVVDEVLAVGDAEFQAKCMGKMQEVASGQGRTVLFVSHNMSAIQKLCTRALLLRKGQLVLDGTTDDCVKEYLSYLRGTADVAFTNDNPERSGTGVAKLTAARLLDGEGNPTAEAIAGLPGGFEFEYTNPERRRLMLTFTVYNSTGVACSCFSSEMQNALFADSAGGRIRCLIDKLPFPPDEYRVAVNLVTGNDSADHLPAALVFRVSTSSFFATARYPEPRWCAVMVDHTWQHEAA